MVLMYHFAGWSGLIADPQVNFDFGYSLITFILITLAVNIGFIIYKTVELWRHKKAVEASRKLVLSQIKELESKTNMIEVKKSKQ